MHYDESLIKELKLLLVGSLDAFTTRSADNSDMTKIRQVHDKLFHEK